MGKKIPNRKEQNEIRPYSVSEIEDLETLCVGQGSDLKVDTGEFRVWLSRAGRADGLVGPRVTYERLIDGRWVLCDDWGKPK
jgi:hypothetical protein